MLLLNSCTLETAVLFYKLREPALYIHEGCNYSDKQGSVWAKLGNEAGIAVEFAQFHAEAFDRILVANPKQFVGYDERVVKRFTGQKMDLGKRTVWDDDTALWYLPQRFMLLILFALSVAEIRKTNLTLGIFPRHPMPKDFSRQRIHRLIKLAEECSYGKFPKVSMPFEHTGYLEILKEGAQLSVPFEKIWTCSNALEKQCGVCAPCLHRRNVFRRFFENDPAEYEPWKK